MGYPLMPANDAPPRQDEFTRDAASFGINVPVQYWHVSNCSYCRDFRNKVRNAREEEKDNPIYYYEADDYDQYGNEAEDYDDFPSEQFTLPPPALDIGELGAVSRITCAINLAQTLTGQAGNYMPVDRAQKLIAELLG